MTDLDDLRTGLPAELAVDADLRLQVSTTTGTTTARVTGSGRRLRVESEKPELLLAAVDRVDVGRVADLLADAGITVDVRGPRGSLASIGAGESDRFGQVVTGSRRVALAPRGAVHLARTSGPVRAVALALLAVLAAGTALGRQRRSSH